MSSDIVIAPEVGRVYLIRRFLNGSKLSRFQPAIVLERTEHAGDAQHFAGFYLKVRWLFDDSEQSDVYEAYATVKELSQRWLRTEYARADEELRLAKKKFDVMYTLRLRGDLGMDGVGSTGT